MEICNVKDCMGCYGCINICPKSAIGMDRTEMNKTYAKVDESKCIHCDKCKKVCPAINDSMFKMPTKCLAAWSESPNESDCSSGGIAAGMGRLVINNKGVVFGVAFERIQGKLALNMKGAKLGRELSKFKGSKYVQASVGNSFSEAKGQLLKGKRVLFIGTPCQIDGLNMYLGKEYDSLVTVDIICHGVPPFAYLEEYIEGTVNKSQITNATFRGANDFFLCLYEGDKRVYKQGEGSDLFFKSFLESLTYRDNCYECKYARKERIADITIGDYWGLDRSTLNRNYDGKVSVVLLNTEKGARFFEEGSDLFYSEIRDLDEAVKENEQLREPSNKHRDRHIFEKEYVQNGFIKAVKATSINEQVAKNKRSNSLWFKGARKIKRAVFK